MNKNQEIEEEQLQELFDKKIGVVDREPSMSEIAAGLMRYTEFVVVGEFSAVIFAQFDKALLENRIVKSVFVVDEVLKGPTNINSILVELNSDMLVYPGDEISRYIKRNQAAADRNNCIKAIDIGQEETETHQALVQSCEKGMHDVPERHFVVIDGVSFYHLEGSIRPNIKYLLSFDIKGLEGKVYKLDEVGSSDSNIFWGERRDGIISALKQLQVSTDN